MVKVLGGGGETCQGKQYLPRPDETQMYCQAAGPKSLSHMRDRWLRSRVRIPAAASTGGERRGERTQISCAQSQLQPAKYCISTMPRELCQSRIRLLLRMPQISRYECGINVAIMRKFLELHITKLLQKEEIMKGTLKEPQSNATQVKDPGRE